MATSYVAAWEYEPAHGLTTQEGESVGVALGDRPVHAAVPSTDLRKAIRSLCDRPVLANAPAQPWPPATDDDELCSECLELAE